ncbi:MAG TPA: nuclear transport factor 2 family protein [Thermoanaerobaculia bacterium]|nr:nuclear transport factor 2 family protein [Thermoanaerobaculia bacterium]
MKTFVAAIACLVIFACRTAAPPPISPFGAGADDLVKRTTELNQAFALRDSAKLETLMAPEYQFHFIDHRMMGTLQATPNAPRGKWAADAFAQLSNGPLEASTVDVRVIGDVGVVVSHYRWSGTYRGEGFRYEGYMTDVWVKRLGRWQVLVSSASLLPPC